MSFSEWRSTTLGEITRIKGGKRLPKGILLTTEKNDHPYIRIRNLGSSKNINLNSDFEFVDDETFSKISRYIVNQDDVILSIVGTIGLVGKIGKTLDNASLTENCIKFVNLTNINRDFLYYFLVSKYGQDEIKKMTVGAVQPKLPIKNIEKIEIKLPLLDEQFRISSILNSLEEKIELNNRINKTLEEMAQAIFKSWFVDFEPFKDGEFVDSEIGLIPTNWRIEKIPSLGEVVGGSTPSKAREEYYSTDGIAWITPKDLSMTDNIFISKGETDITDLGYSSCSLKLLPAGTVLMSSRAPIGYLAIAKNEVTTNQGFKSIVPNQMFGTEFVYLFLKSNLELVKSHAVGSTFMEVSGKILKEIPALIPEDKVIKSFRSIVEPVFKQIEKIEDEVNILREIRDSLLPKLMSGEIRVSLKEVQNAEVR